MTNNVELIFVSSFVFSKITPFSKFSKNSLNEVILFFTLFNILGLNFFTFFKISSSSIFLVFISSTINLAGGILFPGYI